MSSAGLPGFVRLPAFFLPMGSLIVLMKDTGPWSDPGTTAALLSIFSIVLS